MKFDQIQEEVPELDGLECNLQVVTHLPSSTGLSNMTPCHLGKIGQHHRTKYSKYDGLAILAWHDTMAYTASALSYMFENLDNRSF